MVKVAVVLSGCGYLDGSEIQESVLALLYLDKAGAKVDIFAPNISQTDCINHLISEPTDEVRNVLVESARIARGKISSLDKLNINDYDALVMPGGYGAAKNLSNFASAGVDAVVIPELHSVIKGFFKAGKPIGAICISPAILVAALKGTEINVTIGEDSSTISAIESMGGIHHTCQTTEVYVDKEHHIVSCSAYMRGDNISNVATGIELLVKEVVTMSNKS